MGTFSPWHWAVIILILAMVVGIPILIYQSNKRANAIQPKGFGGWIILLAIGVYLAPFRTLADFAKTQQELPQAIRERFPLMVGGEITLTIAFIALEVMVAVQMARKRATFVQWFVWLFIAVCAFMPLDIIWVGTVLQIQAGQSFAATLKAGVTPESIGQWIAATVATGIWTLYVTRSRRVANTFVK